MPAMPGATLLSPTARRKPRNRSIRRHRGLDRGHGRRRRRRPAPGEDDEGRPDGSVVPPIAPGAAAAPAASSGAGRKRRSAMAARRRPAATRRARRQCPQHQRCSGRRCRPAETAAVASSRRACRPSRSPAKAGPKSAAADPAPQAAAPPSPRLTSCSLARRRTRPKRSPPSPTCSRNIRRCSPITGRWCRRPISARRAPGIACASDRSPTRRTATKLCSQLKAQGQSDCMVASQ